MPITLDLSLSEERLLYDKFFRTTMFRRINDLNRLWNKEDLSEFPMGSMLHLIDDNFLMNKPIVLVPDTAGWSMTRKPDRKFVMHILDPDTPPSKIIHLEETFNLPNSGVAMTIMNFKKRNQLLMRPVMKIEDFPKPTRPEVQSIVSYNALYRARIFGLLRGYRRFNYVFTTIFNMIGSVELGRRHFIPIPVGDRVLTRDKFMLSFNKHDKGSLKLAEDPWYLFLVHFLGFLNAQKTPSLFEQVPERYWEYINFVLYTRTKVLVLNMRLIKEFNESNRILWRVLNMINLMAEEGHQAAMQDFGDVAVVTDTKEEPGELAVQTDTPFEDEKEPIYVTTQTPAAPTQDEDQSTAPQGTGRDEEEVTEPVPVAQSPAEPAPSTKEKEPPSPVKTMFTQPNRRKPIPYLTTQQKIKREADDVERYMNFEPQTLTIDPRWLEVEMVEGQQNAPEFKENMTKEEQAESNKAFLNEIDERANTVIENDQHLNNYQAEQTKQAANAYKKIVVDGRTVEEIIQDVPDDTVATNELDFLKDDPDIVDQSMLKSSVNTFEHDYMKKMFMRDLVMNLASFNQQGMFLQDIKMEDVSDSLNQLMEYTAVYVDTNKKTHTIRFKLPKVDERGYCYVNGTLSVLKKQRVPLPICKINPTTVTLTSNYNKYLVMRNVTVAHSFISYIESILAKGNFPNHPVVVQLNTRSWNNITLPYEYTALARKYLSIRLSMEEPVEFYFNLEKRYDWLRDVVGLLPEDLEVVKSIENDAKCIAVAGIGKRQIGFIDINNVFTVIHLDDHTTSEQSTIIDFLCNTLGVHASPLSEWTDLKLLDTTVPVIFALCYRYGLSEMLNYTKTEYRILNQGERSYRNWSDVVIRFADKTLIIPRTPLVNSMLFAGLNFFHLNKINMEEMDSKDIYYDLLQSKKRSVHFLKGIDNFFDLFVDPITREVLEQMKEPTTARDILIRSTQLLTTEDHKPQSSSVNFRFRSYERMNSAVYNTLSRAFANYRNKSVNATHKWSIADYEVQQQIMQDQLKENVDIINPINDIKYQEEYSHAGFAGGRKSLDSFTVPDRQYPQDGVGIISEATVDSAKTAFAASTSMDPTIVNMRGMTISESPDNLSPTQILSISSLIMPGVTQDD